MDQYKYTYLIGTLIVGIVWGFIFYRRKDLRNEQLLMSLLVAGFGTLDHFFWGEYWTPQFLLKIPFINVGLESILLSFFYGGIAATFYEIVFNKKLKYSNSKQPVTRNLEVMVISLVGISVFLFFWSTLRINIIYASTVAMLISGCVQVYFGKEFLVAALVNGLIVSILFSAILLLGGLMYPSIFTDWWQLGSLSGYNLLGVPLEEVTWHFCLGFVTGPIYEVWKGYIDIPNKPSSVIKKPNKAGKAKLKI